MARSLRSPPIVMREHRLERRWTLAVLIGFVAMVHAEVIHWAQRSTSVIKATSAPAPLHVRTLPAAEAPRSDRPSHSELKSSLLGVRPASQPNSAPQSPPASPVSEASSEGQEGPAAPTHDELAEAYVPAESLTRPPLPISAPDEQVLAGRPASGIPIHLRLYVNALGRVAHVEAIDPQWADAELIEQAKRMFMDTRFLPGVLDGRETAARVDWTLALPSVENP